MNEFDEAQARSSVEETFFAIARACGSILALPARGGSSPSDPPGAAERMMVVVAQAYVAWLLGALRSLTRAGVSWAAYGRLLAWQLGAISLGRRDERIRLLLDESAAHLRELGDLSVQEALALRKLLLDLSQQLRQLDDGTLDEPRRFARAKP